MYMTKSNKYLRYLIWGHSYDMELASLISYNFIFLSFCCLDFIMLPKFYNGILLISYSISLQYPQN